MANVGIMRLSRAGLVSMPPTETTARYRLFWFVFLC